jgi:hypothetical protein
MKHETKTSDIRANIACANALNCRKHTLADVTARIDAGFSHDAAIDAAIAARATYFKTAGALAKIPAARRTIAGATIAKSQKIGMDAAEIGGRYSGRTSFSVKWGECATAETLKSEGGQYSRKCTFKMIDATHIITLDPAGVSRLIEDPEIVAASARDGLPLIAYYPDGSAVWIRTKGKAIVSESGWIAGDGGSCYHSTISMADAAARKTKKSA